MSTSIWQRLHTPLTVILAGIIVIAAALVSFGVVSVWFGGNATPSSFTSEQPAPQQAPAPSKPMIEEVKKAPIAFKYTDKEDSALDFRLFRYTGTWIDCWLETEVDGKWVVTHQISGEQLNGFGEEFGKARPGDKGKAEERSKPPDTPLFGYLAWGRRTSKGNEEVLCELLLTVPGRHSDAGSSGRMTLQRLHPDSRRNRVARYSPAGKLMGVM